MNPKTLFYKERETDRQRDRERHTERERETERAETGHLPNEFGRGNPESETKDQSNFLRTRQNTLIYLPHPQKQQQQPILSKTG